MPQPPVQPFDDRALKGALRDALGRESAPASLRDRVGALASQSSAAKRKRIPLSRRSPLYRLAVVAILVIGFGSLGYQIWQWRANQAPDYYAGAAIPDSLYQAMIDAHVARLNQPGGDSVSTLAAAAGLSGQIQRPVFVADLTRDGWSFKGGGVRKVGRNIAAQLFFTKGAAALSVFSLPASAAPDARDGTSYDKIYQGSPVAGFTRSGGLYCIVGSSADGSLQVDEVKRLLEEHRGEIGKI